MKRTAAVAAILLTGLLGIAESATARASELQPSAYLSDATREGIARVVAMSNELSKICDIGALHARGAPAAEVEACEKKIIPPQLAEIRRIYPTKSKVETMGGVRVAIVEPARGVDARKASKILIGVHGGGFTLGADYGGEVEAMPIVAAGGYRVVAVDYRVGSEVRYPAGSQDVIAVYQALLKTYRPENIGLFGCSAGSVLVGETIAWLIANDKPLPGGAVLTCSAPLDGGIGDSAAIFGPALGQKSLRKSALPYFTGIDPRDPAAFPGESPDLLRRFPPTLLIGSTRDVSLSEMLVFHRGLRAAGAPSDLLLFEGLEHGAYIYNPYIPETREAALAVAHFFDKALGTARTQASGR